MDASLAAQRAQGSGGSGSGAFAAPRSAARPRQPQSCPARWTRMANPKQLRARAEECEAKAETAYDPDVRRWYRNMAAQWRKLAQQCSQGRGNRAAHQP